MVRLCGFSLSSGPLVQTPLPQRAALYCWASPELAALGGGVPCANGSNGSLMRTAVLGARTFWDAELTARNTTAVARLTHPDPRVVGACVAMTALVASLLRRSPGAGGFGAQLEGALGAGEAALRRSVDELPSAVDDMVAAVRVLPDHPSFPDYSLNRTGDAVAAAWAARRDAVEGLRSAGPPELRAHALSPSLDALHLDAEGATSYVFKTFGAGCWALRVLCAASWGAAGGTAAEWAQWAQAAGEATLGPELAAMDARYAPADGAGWFKACISELLRRGADADTNGTVAGALMGAQLGLARLPPDWVAGLRHGAWLRTRAEQLADLIVRDWTAISEQHEG
jgi:hypothetical protein